MSALVVEALCKSFGGLRAVDDVSFSLGETELLALIGPNGAGKSTCFNMLNGQIQPDVGSIRLYGDEIVGCPPRTVWRMGVGRTFQITATFSSMTVMENVQMALLSHHRRLRALLPFAGGQYRDEAMALLDRVGMASQAGRACGTLAYGDLKRLELAIALANEPRVLLMDEPTAGMAPRERLQLMRLTADIVRDKGVSVLFTEHDMDVVFGHADRILVMNRGRLVAAGSPAEVRANTEVQAIYLGSGALYAPEGAA
ncbi:ABC transporter ATP-binding protein [Roseospira marina]|uniref:ABC transporter ATP-binding protein n=1 Tax=Roseospira marina TaxID=140057 RepID=A0A5M6IAD7_9PROT|nr:ABC transporter ATP-binding protein [Roseospira marina]KAA5605173.1 ABC transporter ATP-binding protein [Roseospira marina]MBB4314930.1 branched-chain amino acid transport system ATP-binding protein [Roseospira marina]MBB5087930.1 branched-chain amino acid transport system ATP-binding protein [Roseospira marina]